MTRIAIDPNVRVRDNLTVADRSDVEGDGQLFEGLMVTVFESESGAEGKAMIARLTDRLVYLEVDWASMMKLPAIPGGGMFVSTPGTIGTSVSTREETHIVSSPPGAGVLISSGVS